MNKLTVYSSTGQAIQELDIGEETAPFTYKLADIRNPSVKGGAFSKTVKLPGTDNNNQFFGGLYDVNTDYTTFNPNLKTWVRWVSADEEVLAGFMKLNKVYVDDLDDVWYDVVIFDTTVEFWSVIEGKYVFELDNIDELSHVWSGPNIKSSWTTDWNLLGYFYPVLMNSCTWGLGTGGNRYPYTFTERLYPAAFHKRLLEMVIRNQGYTWSGTLKDNEIYEREIIPYTGDHPNITLDDSAARKFKAGWNSDQVGFSQFHGGPGTNNAGYIRNTNRADWNFIGAASFPDEAGSYGFNDNNNVWASPIYTAPTNGQYAFNLNLALKAQLQYYKQGNPSNSQDYGVNFMVYAEINTGLGTYMSNGVSLSSFAWYFPKAGPDTSSTYLQQNSSTTLVFPASSVLSSYTNGSYFVLQSGWTVRFYVGYSSQGLRKATNGNPPYYSGNLNANKEIRIKSFEFKMLSGSFAEVNDSLSSYGEGNFVPYLAFINKKMKQKDLFSDIIARYNAHIYMNPDKENDIVIDTGETFYDPAPEDTEDWSALKENDEHDQIEHMAELQNERFLLTYQQSGDDFSKSYAGATGEIYGQFEHRFTNSFVKGVLKVETPFVETPIIQQYGCYFPAVESQEKDGAMRVLYAPKGGVKMLDTAYGSFTLLGAGNIPYFVEPTQRSYPYAGHLQNPLRVNDTQVYDVANDNDINFGTNAYLFPQSMIGLNSLPPFTLEERYWKRRVDQMNKGKMLSTLLNLTSRHINLIRKKPYTRIWINNAYWQVNLINYEGNDQLRKLTPVELVSIHNLRHIKGRIIKPTRPVIGDVIGVLHPLTSGTNATGSGGINVHIKGFFNQVGNNVLDVYIKGNNNVVFPNSTKVNIENSDNVTVKGNNVTVIDTDDLIIESDNVTIIKGVLFEGETQTRLYNLVDGGEDELRAIEADSKYNLIDSGKNINLNRFAENPIALIDSKTGDNKTIRTNGIDSN